MLEKPLLKLMPIVLILLGAGLASAADTATLVAPASVAAGARFSVTWAGPGRQWDRIGIVPAGAPDVSPETPQSSAASGKSVSIAASELPGEYEVRYFGREPNAVLARRKITVAPVTATLVSPASAPSGARVEVQWTGPKNQYDRIYVVKAGSPEKTRSDFSTPAGESPARLTVPEAPGNYEVRYLTGQLALTLARAPLAITSVTASLQGPTSVTAGAYFEVSWKGPGNTYDHISIAPKAAAPDQYLKSFRIGASPMQIQAPLTTGEFELRYQTGQTQATLASATLRVTPPRQEPGSIRVNLAQKGATFGGTVEVIVDASGSMLQNLGSERRIDIAKRTLKNLTSNVIPAGTPFALRVFGREPNSCQTDLDIAPRPLDRAAVAAKIDALAAKSNAKTPIAASLEKVASDLSDVRGERLVILLTDGEETCGGNPAAAIEKLMKLGINVRVNIVGFAVENRATAALFRQWSTAGGGAYFDARNAASLDAAFSQAVKPGFEIVDAQKKVIADGVVGGDPVKVLPGQYTVRLKNGGARSQSATVQPGATATVDL